MSSSCCSGASVTQLATPEAPGIMCIPAGPLTSISASVFSPLRRCSKVYCGATPSKMLMFARPVSASRLHTLSPLKANVIARFTAILLLPTPPFPLVRASVFITQVARGLLNILVFSRYFSWHPLHIRHCGLTLLFFCEYETPRSGF